MADVTVSSVEVKDGVLHIYGTNFTQTTTVVYVDDVTTDVEFVSATELTIDPAPKAGAEIIVEKSGVQSEPQAVPGDTSSATTATKQDAPGAIGVVNEDTHSTGPMTPSQPYPEGTPTSTQIAPPPTREDYMSEQEKDPESFPGPVTEPVEPVERVETIKVTAKEPYPTGNPQDPENAFIAAHGFRRAPPEDQPAPAEPLPEYSPEPGPQPA